MDELSNSILNLLRLKPNQKAKAIASNLETDRKAVNHCLYSKLKGKVEKMKIFHGLYIMKKVKIIQMENTNLWTAQQILN